jgi:8-oxo-dGTP pyrophosphatase MutT (NUDIX family)
VSQRPNIRVGANAVIVRDGAILLVEFEDETGPHFNFPGGGIEPGESIIAGLQREVREETCVDIEVGPLLLVTEYFPPFHHHHYGSVHKLGLLFRCHLAGDSEPRLPERPDPHQVAVRWVQLADLSTQPLLPKVAERITDLIALPPRVDLFCVAV